jgi:hypothetical protein
MTFRSVCDSLKNVIGFGKQLQHNISLNFYLAFDYLIGQFENKTSLWWLIYPSTATNLMQ